MSSPHHFLELLCVAVLIFWWLGLKVYKQSALSESRTSRITIRLLSTYHSRQQELLRYLEELHELPAHNHTIRLFKATFRHFEREELVWLPPQPVTEYFYLRSL